VFPGFPQKACRMLTSFAVLSPRFVKYKKYANFGVP
jgi:hypothetical protein